MVIFNSYVKLPKGNCRLSNGRDTVSELRSWDLLSNVFYSFSQLLGPFQLVFNKFVCLAKQLSNLDPTFWQNISPNPTAKTFISIEREYLIHLYQHVWWLFVYIRIQYTSMCMYMYIYIYIYTYISVYIYICIHISHLPIITARKPPCFFIESLNQLFLKRHWHCRFLLPSNAKSGTRHGEA